MATSAVSVNAVKGCPMKAATPPDGSLYKFASVAPKISSTGNNNSRITSPSEGAGPSDSTAFGAHSQIPGNGTYLRLEHPPPYTKPPNPAIGTDTAMPYRIDSP